MPFYCQATSWLSIQNQSSYSTLESVCLKWGGTNCANKALSLQIKVRDFDLLFLTIKPFWKEEIHYSLTFGSFTNFRLQFRAQTRNCPRKTCPEWTGYKQSCKEVINGRDLTPSLAALITIWHFISRVFYLQGFNVFCCLKLFGEGQRQAFILKRKQSYISEG